LLREPADGGDLGEGDASDEEHQMHLARSGRTSDCANLGPTESSAPSKERNETSQRAKRRTGRGQDTLEDALGQLLVLLEAGTGQGVEHVDHLPPAVGQLHQPHTDRRVPSDVRACVYGGESSVCVCACGDVCACAVVRAYPE
jgi:hypothetical protein